MENEYKWECFDISENSFIKRLKVDGGYLYHVSHSSIGATTMCFVPDVDLTRYQAHLRDAYHQGFKDGLTEGKLSKDAE